MDSATLQDWAAFIGGFAALIAGGQLLVRGAIGLGQILKIPPLLMGLFLVGFGTSAPEIFVTLQAATRGEPDLALGNVVGSNIANILLVLGICAVISPVAIRRSMVFRDAFMMLAATSLIVWIAQRTDFITDFHGMILFGLMIIYLLLVFVYEQVSDSPSGDRIREVAAPELVRTPTLPFEALFTVGGIILLYLGAQFVVTGARGIAVNLGVTEAVIGLSVLAIGTSLPELVTGIIAATRRQHDILVGNILGSCIVNILVVLGITSLVQPIIINDRIARLDMWIMLAAAVILVPFMLTNWRLSRSEGVLLVAGFVVYMAVLYTGIGLA